MATTAAKTPAQQSARSGSLSRAIRHHWIVYLLGVALPIVLFLAFVAYPLVYSVYLSFMQWDGLSPHMHFVGWNNYSSLFSDSTFWTSFGNTIRWTIGTVIVADGVAFVVAVFLRSNLLYFATFFRTILFIPVTMSLVAIGLMFSFILNPAFGALNQVLAPIVGPNANIDLLGGANSGTYVLIAIYGWYYLGIPMMLFDAGLTQIPIELYDAAKIEGAGPIQTMRHITVPMLRPTFVVVTMLAVIEALRAFDLVLVMTRGGPGTATDVLGYFMYISTFDETQFGYGAAISTVMLLLSLVFAVLYLRRVGGRVVHAGD